VKIKIQLSRAKSDRKEGIFTYAPLRIVQVNRETTGARAQGKVHAIANTLVEPHRSCLCHEAGHIVELSDISTCGQYLNFSDRPLKC
jgi:hypothetical protein